MAGLSTAPEVRIEWLDAPEVTTPELAATWARYEVWTAGRCITQVETSDSTYRRSVYGSLYPLADWIASNWWALLSHVRPSGIDPRYWTWANIRTYPWLESHNTRGAGDGMAWPNLTIVPEGATTRLRWVADESSVFRDLRFVSEGTSWTRTEDVSRALAMVVEHVLDRLAEQNLPKTRLAEEWSAIADADADERDFCIAAARLGLDPYAVSEGLAEEIIHVAGILPVDLADAFFDSASASALGVAAAWLDRSLATAARAASRVPSSLGLLKDAVRRSHAAANTIHPWDTGYAVARTVRSVLDAPETQSFDTGPWVGRMTTSTLSAGLQGAVAVESDRCGLVLAAGALHPTFGSAKALGRALVQPDRRRFILSAARTDEDKVAGAFAAELLAPAEGIRAMLATLGKDDDGALEAVARQYRVSPLLIRHQYDNQIASASG